MLDLPDLVAAGDYLIHWQYPVTSADALQSAAADYAPRRGIRNLREALPYLHERSESRRESLLRVLLVRGGLPGLVVNLPITTSGGFRYRADLAVPERKVLIEYQSAFHEGPTAFRADMTRISRLEADGWLVIQVNADDLDNPAELVARITRVLAGRPVH